MTQTISSIQQEQAGATATLEETLSSPAAPVVTAISVQQETPSPETVVVEVVETPEGGEAPPAVMPRVAAFGGAPRNWRRLLGLLLTGIFAVLFLWQVQAILPPFLIAFCLAALLDPALRAQERHGVSRVRAILALYLLSLLIVILFVILVVPAATTQLEDINKNIYSYYANLQHSTDILLQHNTKLLHLLGIKQQRLSEILYQKSPMIQDSVTLALGRISGLLQSAASKILWLIIIPVATFFFMRDFPMMRARLIALFPAAYHEQIDKMSWEIVDVFSAYLRGLTKVCALFALTAFVLFSLLGVRYAVFLGLMAGAFYAVPYVGQLFTAIGSGTVAYLMEKHTVLLFFHPGSHSVGYALTVVLCAILAQNLFDQIVYPRVVGASVGLHPVVSIFALMAGATLFGVLGMLIAVPVAASIQILLMYFFPKLTQPPPPKLLDSPPPLA